jgi:anaerobic glycerol-3-phosphate dehydrogenase
MYAQRACGAAPDSAGEECLEVAEGAMQEHSDSTLGTVDDLPNLPGGQPIGEAKDDDLATLIGQSREGGPHPARVLGALGETGGV